MLPSTRPLTICCAKMSMSPNLDAKPAPRGRRFVAKAFVRALSGGAVHFFSGAGGPGADDAPPAAPGEAAAAVEPVAPAAVFALVPGVTVSSGSHLPPFT